MPYKNKEARREYYWKNRDKINEYRKEYTSKPEVKKKIRERDNIWRNKNRAKYKDEWNLSKRKSDLKKKKLVFDHYGNICSCCGESIATFLTIDHMNGGGTKHRSKINNNLYTWLVKNNFPTGFQTLCFNCNWGRHINGGVCPHKNPK